jgi:class 3 adenylate cyclase
MAFWGEPTPNEHHAVECVRSAIDSQRAIADLNEKRIQENQRRELDNQKAIQEGRPPLPLLSVLSLGSGINTGVMTVGLMGSDAHIYNYTVFGREVNLASRLEGVSGRGRIIISESTFADLQRDDPTLAATCVEQPSVMVKGISKPVKIYLVPWQTNKSNSTEPSAIAAVSAVAALASDPAAALPKSDREKS